MKGRRPVLSHPTDPTAALVELTKGYWAVIDAADAIAVGRFDWHALVRNGRVYAHRSVYLGGPKRKQKRESLHRFIGREMGLVLRAHVDHRDGNGLDCRRQNLRDATPAQNQANQKRSTRNRSGVKGVSWHEGRQRWIAQVSVKGGRLWKKRFKTIEEAAAAVAVARLEIHGEFANHGTKETLQ